MKKATTLRLTIPEWHGGVNPNYPLGARLMEVIAPGCDEDESILIPVLEDFTLPLENKAGIDGFDALLRQKQETARVLRERQPDKVIVFGGDCSVSLAPFDYLSGKYGRHLGLIWLDAHPDIATAPASSHLHEMVLGNLLGRQPDIEVARVEHPLDPKQVLMAGLIDGKNKDVASCETMNLTVLTPKDLRDNPAILTNWLRGNDIRYLAVHWDLDVLSPLDYRSISTALPYTRPEDYSFSVGELTLKEVVALLNTASKDADLVGLSIAEHLPWDAFNLRSALSELAIFK